MIPEDWEVKGLLDAVKIANGQVDPKIAPFRSMPLVAPDHIESGTGKLLETRTAEEQRAISGKYLFGPGDIVYSKIRPYLKKAILADFQGLCSADMYPMTPHQGVEGGYVFALLLAHQFTKYAESVSVRSGMPKINRVELADFNIPLPPLPEQRAIAAALSDLDAALAGVLGVIAKKQDLKQAAMQTLLTGQTRLPGFSGDWEEATFATLVRHHAGNSALIKGKLPPSPRAGLFPGFSASGQDVWCETYEFEGNAIIVSAVGSRCGKAFTATGQWCAIANTHVVWPNEELVDRQFLNLFLNDEDFWQKSGTGQPFVLFKSTFMQKIALPPKAEQTAIAAVLSDMDAEIAALTAQADKIRLLKQAMMQDLLSGRVRLPLPEVTDA